jgi:hypothetical protein
MYKAKKACRNLPSKHLILVSPTDQLATPTLCQADRLKGHILWIAGDERSRKAGIIVYKDGANLDEHPPGLP